VSGRWISERSFSTNGEHHLAVIQLPRVFEFAIQDSLLRSVAEKVGADFAVQKGGPVSAFP
jgi:hypothetical protein